VLSLAVAAPSLSALWQLYVDRDALSRLHAGVKRYLAEIPEVGQAVGARFIEPMSKSIAIEGVTYTYHGRPVLEKLNLTIPAHSTTAIISPEPVTARVLAQLLPRFIEPQVGRILFDNQDIAFGTLESLREETGYISGQDSVLTGTILENLTCGDSAISLPDATEAAKKSHAHNFIQRLPQGYETVVGERGVTLDSGECFRLAVARALLRDPAVLIIEEPDVALDDDTKSLIDDAYARLCPGRTVIFLPTRLSTIKRCGRVVLLREGSIVADGKHTDLVRNSEEYRHWEYTQFNSFQRRT
jgi:ABC-type multidrug transport system fused ATPase/permease subunit